MIGVVLVLRPVGFARTILVVLSVGLKFPATSVEPTAALFTVKISWGSGLENVAPAVLSSLKSSPARFVTACLKEIKTSTLAGWLMNLIWTDCEALPDSAVTVPV